MPVLNSNQTLLEQCYPTYRMHLICRVCRGNADKALGRFRCGACKLSKKDYETNQLSAERTEFEYLYETWLKVKGYKQITTGIAKLDFILQMLFGIPHTDGWRDYKRAAKPVEMSRFVVLRTVRV